MMTTLLYILGVCAATASPYQADTPLLALDPEGHTAQVARVLFTPDNRQVISVSLDKTVRVWDVKSMKPWRVVRPPIGEGYEGSLYTGALARDGRLLAVAGYNQPGRKWARIHLIDVDENRLVRTLRGHTHDVISLAFSPDGRALASGSRDNTAILWEVSSGAARHVLRGHRGHVTGLAFSPDNQRLATTSHDGTARIWDAGTGQSLLTLAGHTDKVKCVAWSADGRTIVTGSYDRRVLLWNPNGALRQAFPPMANAVTSLVFAPDSRRLLVTLGGVASDVTDCWILDVTTNRWLSRFGGHARSVIDGDLSPDGTLAATADGDGVVYLWRTADGARRGPALVGASQVVWSAGWGPDARSIAWGSTDRGRTIDAGNPLERTFRPGDLKFGGSPPNGVQIAWHSRGPIHLQVVADARSVSVLNGNAPQSLLRLPAEYPDDLVRCFTLLPGDRAAVGSDFKLYLFDIRTGRLIRTFQGHTAPVYAVAPSPDGRYMLSASADMTLRIWVPDRDLPLLSLFFAGPEWIAWTPEGYYAASLGGEQLMGWHVNNGPDRMASFYPASQFRKTLYRPDVIKILLEAGSTARALAQADRERGRQSDLTAVGQVLPPRVHLLAPVRSGMRLAAGGVEVRAAADPVGGRPVTSLRLLVNGRPHPLARRDFANAAPVGVAASWQIDLPPGVHRLSAKATSAVSDATSDEVEAIVGGAGPDHLHTMGDLYVVAFGINAYRDPKLVRLDCARNDAESIIKSFRQKSRTVFRNEEVRLLRDGEATRRDMLDALDWLRTRTKPGDVAVVFYAGHGYADPKTGVFSVLPVDVRLRELARTGIDADQIKERLQIPSYTLLLLDACQAGGFTATEARVLSQAAEEAVRQMVYEEGMIVIGAATKDQSALEENNHGYFTTALMEGLEGRARRDADGLIDVSSLWQYIEPRVLELSDREQNPTISRASTVKTFPLAKP
jgi:WD40 repeat protein